MGLWEDLGISAGTAILVLIALYFIIKWAVKKGIKEAYFDITGKKTAEEIKEEEILKEYGYGTTDEEQLDGAEEM